MIIPVHHHQTGGFAAVTIGISSYNVQIGVDSEYIVAEDIFQDRNDVWTLIPFLKRMKEKLGFCYPGVTADSGYESEEVYSHLREEGQRPYIKPQTYEKWKKRSFKKTSANGRTWHTMRDVTLISATTEGSCGRSS